MEITRRKNLLTVIAEKLNIENDKITINDRTDCNHIANVFRLNVGDSLRVVDGEYEYLTEILNMSNKK